MKRLLVLFMALLVASAAVAIIGFRPGNAWVINGMVEPMGLEGVGLSPEEGYVHPGGLLGTSDGSEVDVMLGEALRIHLDPRTRIQLPSAPGRWFRREVTIDLEKGSLRGNAATARDARLLIRSGDQQLRVRQGTFEVVRDGDSTCVLLSDGEAVVIEDGGVVRDGGATGVKLVPGERTCFRRRR